MSGPKRFLVACGVAVAALLLVRSVWGQELQEIKRLYGTTIKVPANVPPHVLERIRSGGGPGGPRSEPGKPDEKGDAQEQKGGEEDKDKKSEEGEQKEKDEGKKDEEESEEKPEPITRESAPPGEADPKELEVRPDERGMVQFNFVGQKWLDVLEWLAVISDMSLDWQELPGDYLNLTTQRAYSVRETRNLINQHLLARGFTLLSRGEILSVAKVDKLDPSMVPRVAPEELEKRDSHEYVKVSFSLDWMLAEKAVEEFESMKSPNGKLTSLTATNRLEAMDAVTNLCDIYRVLEEEQSGTGQERLVREFPLEHTGAEEVLATLQELLGVQQKSSASPKPMTPDQMRAAQEAAKRAAAAAAAAKKGAAPSKPKPDVYLVANTRKNSILANAPPDIMAKIEQAIEAIDVPSDRAHSLLRNMERMQVYRLESVEPEPLIKTLEELGELDFDTRLEADRENNAIVAYASLADHLTIRALVEQLDGGGRRAEVLQLTALRAESVARIVDFMMGGGREEEQDRSRSSRSSYYPWDRYRSSSSRRGDDDHADRFRVDADAKNNTLVLWCNDFELRKVEDLLERLRENQWEGDDPNTLKVYRLAVLDPEPFVQTLEDLETLGFQARLEVDEENNSIIAYASESDHARIQELIDELDGSGRQFHVVPLRRLEADYVAGTIAFMMAGEDDKQQSGYSRSYYYFDSYGPSGRGQDKKPDEFRVDADVEYNRLLLWANEIEMEEVNNLLVKLGEIPPEGGDSSTVRVLDVLPGPEKDKLLERIRRVWPSLAPNPLVTPEPEEPEEKKSGEDEDGKGAEEEGTPAKSRPTTAAGAATAPASPAVDSPLSSSLRVAGQNSDGPVFRFAQLDQKSAESAASQESEPTLPQKSAESGETVQQQATSEEASPEGEKQPAPAAHSPGESTEAPPESGQPPAAAAPTDDARIRPPVSITEAPDGRLIITSEDTEALDQLEDLISRLAPPRKDYHVFELKFAEAYWVKWNLDDFFKEEDKESGSSSRYDYYYWGPRSSGSKESTPRLSRRKPLRFISDDDTNTILVQGAAPDQLRTIQDLIDIYDQPPSTDSESARKTEVFQIHYSKADVVAEAVKEVYRDLLSDRDKALANRGQQQQKTESRYSYTYVLGDEGDERKMPRWKGYLSVGIDTLSNTLVVSAPEFLFRDIEQLIKDLDEAAKPTDAVQVLQLGQGVSATVVHETLSKVLAEAAAAKRSGGGGAKRPAQGTSGQRRGPAGN